MKKKFSQFLVSLIVDQSSIAIKLRELSFCRIKFYSIDNAWLFNLVAALMWHWLQGDNRFCFPEESKEGGPFLNKNP